MNDMQQTITASHTCLHCGRPITQPNNGLPKRFCSTQHRMAYHAARRYKADAILRAARDVIEAFNNEHPNDYSTHTAIAIQAMKELMQ